MNFILILPKHWSFGPKIPWFPSLTAMAFSSFSPRSKQDIRVKKRRRRYRDDAAESHTAPCDKR